MSGSSQVPRSHVRQLHSARDRGRGNGEMLPLLPSIAATARAARGGHYSSRAIRPAIDR